MPLSRWLATIFSREPWRVMLGQPWTIVPSLPVNQQETLAIPTQADLTLLPRRNAYKAQDDFVVEQPWGSSPPQAISQPVYIIPSGQPVA